MLKTQILLPREWRRLLMKRWLLASLTGTTRVEELVVGQCVSCPIVLIPTLIECNQEITVQEEGEASLIASTSNRPASIATLNDASEGMNPLVRDHPVRIMPSLPSFSSISPIYCKTSCPKHDVKRHNYALTITTTTRGTCLRSRYPVLVIIRELEDSTSRPSVAS